MNALDANRLFEMDLASHFMLCMDLIRAVAEGHEVMAWSEQDEKFFSVGDDGEERPLLPISDEPMRSHILMDMTRAVEMLASIEGTGLKTGHFLMSIGDHQVMVGVEEVVTNSHGTIILRMNGAKEARERARAMLPEILRKWEEHDPMILSWDGKHILGHGTLRPKYRMAELIEYVSVFALYLLCVGLICVLFALTPLKSILGISGWIACVTSGLWLGLVITPYVFARERQP